jgi:4-amino-4-deoxy-L-arabinose transferase-like glycosyltransferase
MNNSVVQTNSTNFFEKVKPIVWIIIVALLIRIIAAFYLGNKVSGLSGAFDEISYSILGHRFADGYGFTFPTNWYPWIQANSPQSYYSIAMSFYLGVIYKIFGFYPIIARLITAVFSTLIVVMIYLLSSDLFGEKVATISALIASFYAYLVFYGVTLVTETPFILCLLIVLYLSYQIVKAPSKMKWISLGIFMALGLLFRMAFIFVVPFLLGWILLKQPIKRSYVFFPIILIILTLVPFTIRNYFLWGRFMVLESQFGHVFWNGNNPAQNGNFHPYRVFPIPEDILASHNDAEITSRLLALGIKNVLNNPADFMMLTLTRLREFFKFWPTADSTLSANLMRMLSFGILWPFSVMGIFLTKERWSNLIPIWLFMIIHTGVYSISWTMVRYRIPVDSVLIPFASYALIYISDHLKGRFRSVLRSSQAG